MRTYALATVVVTLVALAGTRAAGAADAVPGDVSCNARADAIDATLILQLDAQLVGTLPCQAQGDVNGDTRINAIDSSFILQSTAGLIPSFGTMVSINITTPQPIGAGEEFVADVRVENTSGIAAYEFELAFDAADITFVRMESLGSFFNGSDRSPICTQEEGTLHWNCFSPGPPVCLGGGRGPSGTGILGRAVFRAEQAGTTPVGLTDTLLVWDNVSPCVPPDINVYPIDHKTRNTTVTIE